MKETKRKKDRRCDNVKGLNSRTTGSGLSGQSGLRAKSSERRQSSSNGRRGMAAIGGGGANHTEGYGPSCQGRREQTAPVIELLMGKR